MKKLFAILILVLTGTSLPGQDNTHERAGRVSFISSQNVYVKFITTQGITQGDTLFQLSGQTRIPALVVDNLSSVSCVCTPLKGIDVIVDQIIIARLQPTDTVTDPEQQPAREFAVAANELQVTDTTGSSLERGSPRRLLRGSVSVNSWSDFPVSGGNFSNRFRYSLNLATTNQSDTGLSAQAWITFRHKPGSGEEVRQNFSGSLKVYSLSLTYGFNPYSGLTAGRMLNPAITNIGAVDGLMYERRVSRFTFGAVAGTRPDGSDYGFNPRLFSYGGYVAYRNKTSDSYSGTSLAFMQQMNGASTDRRFVYFQHSNTILRNLYLFNSFELDLYRPASETNSRRPALTSAYLSVRYRISTALTLTGSYDARRNVIYYETFRSTTDSLLNYGLRQGLRLGATWRLSEKMTAGLNTGYRFLASDNRPSVNVNGYFNYNQMPITGMSGSLNGTWISTGYMNGYLAGATLYKDFLDGAINTSFGYRFVHYNLVDSNIKINQHSGEIGLSGQLSKNLSLSAYYEPMIDMSNSYHRVYLQIRKRF
jgi:hypothetical protein